MAPSVAARIVRAGFQAADIGLLVEQRGGELIQHARPVFGVDQQLHREALRGARAHSTSILRSTSYIRFCTLGQLQRMHRDALAARHVADDGFAANRIAALGAIDQQVVDALDLDDQVLVVRRVAAAPERLRARFGSRRGCGVSSGT